MQIGVLGINHKLANLRLRESLVKQLLSRMETGNHIYLATCNRVEIYFSSKDLAKTHSELLGLLCEEIEEEVAHKLYSYFGEDCFLHLAKVTAGLDSALLFETEIQGQVKRAYQKAAAEGVLCPELHFVFQKSLAVGKRVRSSFPTTKQMPDLSETLEKVASTVIGPLQQKRILFVGLSEINLKLAHALQVGRIEFCNRSQTKKALLRGQFVLHPLERLYCWQEYDISIFGTSCPHYLLEEALPPSRKHVMVDFGVPRNVHPALGKVPNLTLLNVDQMHSLIDRRRKGQAKRLAYIAAQQVTEAVLRYQRSYRVRRLHPLALVG